MLGWEGRIQYGAALISDVCGSGMAFVSQLHLGDCTWQMRNGPFGWFLGKGLALDPGYSHDICSERLRGHTHPRLPPSPLRVSDQLSQWSEGGWANIKGCRAQSRAGGIGRAFRRP